MSHRRSAAQAATALLDDLSEQARTGQARPAPPLPTGFRPLDQTLSGGIRPGELVLVGGHPGVGKTIATLQWARNMAWRGAAVLYACYEHEELDLLARLALLEAGEPDDQVRNPSARLRAAVTAVEAAGGALREHLHTGPVLGAVRERMDSYADRLWLARAIGSSTGVAELDEMVTAAAVPVQALFVDYLQKVSVRPDPGIEAERIIRVVEGLKDLALRRGIAVIAVAAADHVGGEDGRLRMSHLRGASALAYEGDIAVILNDKVNAVSKVHLAYDPVRAARFRDYVVFSLEKNRGGQAHLDMEFRKDFGRYRFDPEGAFVSERLVDERQVAD